MRRDLVFVLSLLVLLFSSLHLGLNPNKVKASPDYAGNCCLGFDGVDDHVGCSALDVYKAEKFSIELWIKPKHTIQPDSDLDYGHQIGGLIGSPLGGTEFDGWYIYFRYWDGRLGIALSYQVTTAENTTYKLKSNRAGGRTFWDENLWYHLAITFDHELPDANLKIYVNSTLDWAINSSRSVYYETGDLRIGGSIFDLVGGMENSYFGGLVDEVRYWNVSRSSIQIAEAYNRVLNETEISSPELIGYWRFDEGIGTYSQDFSNHDNDATLASDPAEPEWFYLGCPIVPEFPSFLVLPLLIITTLLAVIVHRRLRISSSSKPKNGEFAGG